MQFRHEIFGRDTRENILLAFRLFTLQAIHAGTQNSVKICLFEIS